MRLGTTLRDLVGSGDRIGLLTLPILIVGLAMNLWRPAAFSVGGPPALLTTLSVVVLIPGVIIWLWSAALIMTRVPRGELITSGPYALVKHPLYTAVALLVIPWAGFLLDTWLGVVVGAALYLGSRRFSPLEERTLAKQFGADWAAYRRKVLLPWL
jgi:protein-S-isoprenylcysteine O-methyltransferase Ste14